jgi:hypothetical protein
VMIRVCKRPASSDRDETRIALLRKDHAHIVGPSAVAS